MQDFLSLFLWKKLLGFYKYEEFEKFTNEDDVIESEIPDIFKNRLFRRKSEN